MACGAPVLTTPRASLPEVGGDAVAYTEPDAESIAVALRALLDDPERRAALGVGEQGPQRHGDGVRVGLGVGDGVAAHLGQRVPVGRQHRGAAGHRLKHRQAEAFAP
ncbi:MAG TPA: glycosyltransferase [Trebonia sp.]|nr:glycosyltransferase [Trebonia sp.]